MLQEPNSSSKYVSVEHIEVLARRLPYLRIYVSKIFSGEKIQWQNIHPGSYGIDDEGRFFLVTKIVTIITTSEITNGKPVLTIEPVYMCILQRFPEDKEFVEYTTNTSEILFRLSIDSLREVVNILQSRKGSLVDLYS